MSKRNGISQGGTRAQRVEQQAEALRLRRDGLTMDDIAARMGISQPTVSRRIAAALAECVGVEVETLRQVESARLDLVVQRITEVLNDPRTRATDQVAALRTLVSTSTERRNLFGLTPPIRQEITVTPGPLADSELSSVEKALGLRPAQDTHRG